MDEEWQPEAIVRVRLEALQKDFSDYTDKNIDRIDESIPVFFGHVVATLEKSFPDLSDDLYDKFIDGVTIKVLETSRRADDIVFVGKLFDYALRNKKKKSGRALYDIMLGMKMINTGKYADAIQQLKKYRSADAIICPAIAYCHYVLSTQAAGTPQEGHSDVSKRTDLMAREQMIELVKLNPPVNRLREMDIPEDPGINRIFWFMLKQAISWFPSEREFFRIGLEKAAKDGRKDMREELLSIAVERFFNDMYFLRELYKLKLENRDAGGVAGVVKQMTQQYPDDLEPIYYGLKLSIMTARVETYHRFRKLAVQKNLPANVLLLHDFAFMLMTGKQYEALACLDEIKLKFGPRHYYVTLLEYVAHDFLSEDEKKVKQAKKAVIDSIDQYSMRILKIPTV